MIARQRNDGYRLVPCTVCGVFGTHRHFTRHLVRSEDFSDGCVSDQVAFIAPREESRVSGGVEGTIHVELAHGCLHAER